jgi:hypothetical protein
MCTSKSLGNAPGLDILIHARATLSVAARLISLCLPSCAVRLSLRPALCICASQHDDMYGQAVGAAPLLTVDTRFCACVARAVDNNPRHAAWWARASCGALRTADWTGGRSSVLCAGFGTMVCGCWQDGRRIVVCGCAAAPSSIVHTLCLAFPVQWLTKSRASGPGHGMRSGQQ